MKPDSTTKPLAPIPWRSTKDLTATEQDLCRNLLTLSVDVAHSAFATKWKSRKHRDFSGPAASKAFSAWVSRGGVRDVLLVALKEAAAVETEGRELTLRIAVRLLKSALPEFSRPRGRPKKRPRRTGGLILGSMDTSLMAARQKERLGSLRAALLPYARGTKVGAFAKQEGFRNLDAVKKHLEQSGRSLDDPEVDSAFSDSKAVQAYINEYGLDPSLKNRRRLQKQLSRAKSSR